MKLNDYEQTLLSGWEEVYKKGQLSLWILLALKDGPKHMAAIKQRVAELTNHTLMADDKSMYRALRRYSDAELVSHTSKPSTGGPDLKVYSLTKVGVAVLQVFLRRNITDVFYKPEVQSLIRKG